MGLGPLYPDHAGMKVLEKDPIPVVLVWYKIVQQIQYQY
jgi:hypothetical protein